jgi:hypothetical protein
MSRGVSSVDVAPTLTPSPGMASAVTAERRYVQPAMSCVPDEPVGAANIVLSGSRLVDSSVQTVILCVCVPGIDCGTQRCVAVVKWRYRSTRL